MPRASPIFLVLLPTKILISPWPTGSRIHLWSLSIRNVLDLFCVGAEQVRSRPVVDLRGQIYCGTNALTANGDAL